MTLRESFVSGPRAGAVRQALAAQFVTDRGRLTQLILIMTTVAAGVAVTALFTLYDAAFEVQRDRLIETARSHARLMESIARFDARYSDRAVPGGALAATLGQIREAHERFEGFGETGEFTLARREGDQIVFILRHRHLDLDSPAPVAFHSDLAEPMRRALSGTSGSVVGRDYRGVIVLAAHEPVEFLNLGIVAKIDLAEIRAPFIRAGFLSGGVTLALIVMAAISFRRIGDPLIRRLEENERKYRTLFDNAVDGVIVMTDRFEACNEQLCRLWACRREDIIGRSLLDFSPEQQPDGGDSAETAREHVKAALAGEPQSFYWRHRRQDGTPIDMDVSLKSVELSSHKAILATFRDVTEARRAEVALRRSEKELALRTRIAEIFLTVPDHEMYSQVLDVILKSLDSKHGVFGYIDEEVNLVCPSMTKDVWSECQAVDKTLRFPPETWSGLWGRALAEKRTLLANGGLNPPKGHIAIHRAMIVPIMHRGELIGALQVANKPADYDEEDKRLLEAIADYIAPVLNARLQRDIQEKERRRAERERESLIRKLRDQNVELEQFTYTVSHDLKSPLVTISGFLGRLEEHAVDGNIDDLRADISRIRRASTHMKRLLDDLLELSRIGRVSSNPEEVSLHDLVQEAIELCSGAIKERGVEVVVAPDLPVVFGDRARLLDVLQNLFDNAIKFMGEQANPRLDIGFRHEGTETIFCVRDNGMGIEPRHQERVFGLFERLNPESEGTGIGLAVVKRIVELHNGRVWVESEGSPRGASFCFTLPGSDILAEQEKN